MWRTQCTAHTYKHSVPCVYTNVQDIMIQYSLSLIYVTTHHYVTGWTTDQSQLCTKYEQEIFLSFKMHRSVMGFTHLLFNSNWWFFCWSAACNWLLTST